MNLRIPAVAMLLFAAPLASPLAAQPAASSYRYELTPTVSYQFGGRLDAESSPIANDGLEVVDSAAFGLTLDIPVSRHLQIELLASRQSTELRFKRDLFGRSSTIADLDVSYYHAGILWQGGDRRVSPFFVASAGVASLDPSLPGASTENRFSMSLGGGVKVFLSENVGLRFEGRGFISDFDAGNRRDSYDCYYDYYDDYCYGDLFSQGRASVGLIFAW